jgi:GT2 family glycosyltransferase
MRPLYCVIPSKTDEYLGALLQSMQDRQPGSAESCIVGDDGLSGKLRQRWPAVAFVPLDPPFIFAAAINRGIEVALRRHAEGTPVDILVLNDDTEILTTDWHRRIRGQLAQPAAARFGLLSLMIEGGVANADQRYRSLDDVDIVETLWPLCFVCTVIRFEALRAVGQLDEGFWGYGYDDDDYSRRVRAAGFGIGVTNVAVVRHGRAGFPHSSSYIRYLGTDAWRRLFEMNRLIYRAKWDEPPA